MIAQHAAVCCPALTSPGRVPRPRLPACCRTRCLNPTPPCRQSEATATTQWLQAPQLSLEQARRSRWALGGPPVDGWAAGAIKHASGGARDAPCQPLPEAGTLLGKQTAALLIGHAQQDAMSSAAGAASDAAGSAAGAVRSTESAGEAMGSAKESGAQLAGWCRSVLD